MTVFQTLCFSLTLPLSNPLQPKISFLSNPIIFRQKSLQNHFKVCFPKHCFHFCLRLYSFQLRVLKIGDFRKIGLGFIFLWIFFKILIGLSPIACGIPTYLYITHIPTLPTYLYTFACGFSSIPTSPFPYHWEVDSPNTYHTLSECQVRICCCWEALEEAKDSRCNMELVTGSGELDKTRFLVALLE